MDTHHWSPEQEFKLATVRFEYEPGLCILQIIVSRCDNNCIKDFLPVTADCTNCAYVRCPAVPVYA